MNWKKIAILFWPLVAWPSQYIAVTLIAAMPIWHASRTVADTYYYFFINLGFPVSMLFLILFALSIILWLHRPNCWTFAGTIFTAWGLLGPFGIALISATHFRHIPIFYSQIPLSIRLLVILLIAASPYIVLLIRLAWRYRARLHFLHALRCVWDHRAFVGGALCLRRFALRRRGLSALACLAGRQAGRPPS